MIPLPTAGAPGLPTFSVIIPTIGRDHLARTLRSIDRQNRVAGDQVLVIRDDPPHGDQGAWARNEGMRQATASHLLFMDDDDEYTLHAFDIIRLALAGEPDRVHIFRMRRLKPFHDLLWTEQDLSKPGQVSTQMMVIPNVAGKLPRWTPRVPRDGITGLPGHDFEFLTAAVASFGPPVWHEDIIALVWPAEGNTWIRSEI